MTPLLARANEQLVMPRFGTPRNPSRQTRGGEVAEVARRLGQPLLPWQRHVADVALEIDNDTGQLWYTEIDLTIMRQCGKTLGWMFPWLVWRMTVVPHRLGRQQALFTMQDRNKARVKLERDMAPMLREAEGEFVEITNPKGRPSKSTRQWKLGLNNGSEHLLFGRGNYMFIETPSEKAGHSSTLDAAGIDEARFHRTDEVEQGVEPTMLTRDDAQLLVTSTAGNYLSQYLYPKVVAGRRAVEEGRESRTCFFEYSIPDEAPLEDPATWLTWHPAVGHTISLDTLLDKLEKARSSEDPDRAEDKFRNEYANQWITWPVLGDGDRPLVIPLEAWLAASERAAGFAGDVVLGVDVASDGASAVIVAAGRDAAGMLQMQVVHHALGSFWLEAELAAQVAAFDASVVTYDGGNPANVAAAGQITRGAKGRTVKAITGAEYSASCEGFRRGVLEGAAGTLGGYVPHPDEVFTLALAGAGKKKRGAGWLWDRETALADITPLPAATCAARVVDTVPPPKNDATAEWFRQRLAARAAAVEEGDDA